MQAILVKYFSIFQISYKDKLYYSGRIFAQIILLFVRVGILICLYKYAFSYVGGELKGINASIACWSIGVYFIIFSLQFKNVYQMITNDIISGNIEIYRSKPFNYLFYRIFLQAGFGLPDGIISLLACIFFLFVIVGSPSIAFSFFWISQVLAVTILGFILIFCIYILIGLSAFWLQNSRPIYWIIDKAIMVFGGAYIPIALFPVIMQKVAAYSPFGACLFSTYIFYPNFDEIFLKLILIQLFWIITLIFLVIFIYKKAQQRLSINGG